MTNKVDAIDMFFIRLFRNGWFYLAASIVGFGIFIWTMQPSWEETNRKLLLTEIHLINQQIAHNPISAYDRWERLQKFINDRAIRSKSLQVHLSKTSEIIKKLYPEIKEKLDRREQERKAVEAIKSEAKRADEAYRAFSERQAKRREALVKKYKNIRPSAKEAVAALKRLEAFTEVGVNKTKYAEALGETWGSLKIFVESPEGQSDYPELSLLLVEAIELYKKAGEFWNDDQKYFVQQSWALAGSKISEIDDLVNH